MTNQDLAKYDFVLLLDKSGSMSEKDCPGGKSRWEYAQESTVALARKCAEFDSDGITVVPFARNFKAYENITGGDEKTKQIFQENEPNGSTDTAKALGYVLGKYFDNPVKPLIVLVITDGLPDDEPALVRTIVDASKKINSDDEVGISFIQIGQDKHATQFLKRLDDNLVNEGAKFDIVDTKTADEMEDMSLTDVLIQALTD